MDLSAIVFGVLLLAIPIMFGARPQWLLDSKYIHNACWFIDACALLPFLGVDSVNTPNNHLNILALSPMICFLEFKVLALLFKLLAGRNPLRYIRGAEDPRANLWDTLFFFSFAILGFASSLFFMIAANRLYT